MTPTPTLADIMHELEELSGEQGLDPGTPIADLPIDSLILIEWLYAIEELTNVPVLELCMDVADVGELSVRLLYELVERWTASEAD